MTFNCSICEKGYNSSYGLRRHVSEKHECARFKCSCGRDFSRKLTLNNHKINCMEGNTSVLNSDLLSNVAQSSENQLNFVNHNTKNLNGVYNNTSDSSNCCESDEGEDVSKSPEKRLRISHKSQNGSGGDTDRSGYKRKGDIFSKNNSLETDSEESISDDSDESDSNHSKICYCRECNSTEKSKIIKFARSKKRRIDDQSKGKNDSEENSSDESNSDEKCYYQDCNSSKNFKIKYGHSKKRKFNNRSGGRNESEEGNSDGETEIDEDSNPYSKYYKSQANGGGVLKTIIGNSNQTENIKREFSNLPITRFPTGRIGYGFMKPVSSYL